jgi:hypothetical protein
MANQHADAGRLGGLQTYLRHGREHMAAMGRQGGRPRAMTFDELKKQPEFLKAEEEARRRMDTPGAQTNSLVKLKRLWRLRRKGSKPAITNG